MALTNMQLEQYRRDGFIIVPDVYTAAEMREALEAMERIFYGKTFAEHLADLDASSGATAGVKDGFHEGGHGRAQFATGVDALDRLIENDNYLDIFEQCLGTDRIAYCNAHLFMRSGPTDKRHAANPWEGYHIDHDTNTFLPPSARVGLYDYVNSGVYLHDVEDDGAPMHVIPGSHTLLAEMLPRWFEEGSASGRGSFPDIREITEFAKPIPTVAKAGSALFYSSYLVHAAVPFANKRRQRALWTLSCCRADASSSTKYSNVYRFGERDTWIPFCNRTSPRVRALFGWPRSGDPYYTPQTLDLLRRWWPDMDLAPYRGA